MQYFWTFLRHCAKMKISFGTGGTGMKKAEKLLCEAAGAAALAGTGLLWLVRLLKKHTVRCQVNFAGQRPGIGVVKGPNGAAILYCSTKFDPHFPEKAAAVCWAAVSVLLAIAAAVHSGSSGGTHKPAGRENP